MLVIFAWSWINLERLQSFLNPEEAQNVPKLFNEFLKFLIEN